MSTYKVEVMQEVNTQQKQLAIEINNLSVAFDGHNVLESINLQIKQNEFYAIIGPNGGGKSVLLKTILGIIKPTTGEVRVFGTDIRECKKNIGYVPQFLHYDFAFPISALEVVLMGRLRQRTMGKAYRQEDIEISEKALLEVAITEDIRKKPFNALSGGQKQRVIIARALAAEPDILLLDEPTSSIDTATNERMNELFAKLHKNGKTIIIVTHDIGAISAHITKVACLNTQLLEHGEEGVDEETIKTIYGCNIDLIAHGVPHRVLHHHRHKHKE